MDYIRISSAANSNLQNHINTSLILHYIRKNGSSYRSEISKALGLSLPAVSRGVQLLIDKGILKEERIVTETGKKAHEVTINASLGIFVGVCIELPLIKFSRMDMAGHILGIHEMSINNRVEDLNQFIIQALGDFISDSPAGISTDPPVRSIGLSLPVAVDPKTEEIHAVLYRRLEVKSLQSQMAERFDVPVMMENNENLAAHAEKFYENGIEENTFAFITVHEGTGAGLMIDGRIHQGTNGAAGEIGYQHLLKDSRSHSHQSQTYETLASINKIQIIAMDIIHSGHGEEIFREANYTYADIDYVMISRLAGAGSRAAMEVFERYGQVLAMGLANLLVIINPQTLILGGALCEVEDPERLVVDPLRRALAPLLPFPAPDIRMTRLDRKAAVIGAAQFALENTIYRDYPYIIG